MIAGFQGVDENGNITTLGRGGSDTTAVAIAAALEADVCEIYTDVDGVYTTDPNICPTARKIERISYEEMLELASLGAKVLQIRSVEIAHEVRRSDPRALELLRCRGHLGGRPRRSRMEDVVVSGVTVDKDEAQDHAVEACPTSRASSASSSRRSPTRTSRST